MSFAVYATGLMTGLSLIVAIGAQNAFVLRQGLRNEHVLAVCLACSLSDAALIALGVTSFRRIVALLPWLDPAMRYGGAAFLAWWAAKSLRASLRPSGGLAAAEAGSPGLAPTLGACLALTWLNPHVYLDTVVLLGTLSTRFPGREASFALGAVTGSFLFFFALGFGATRLKGFFANPSSWRALDALIAVTMGTIAAKLVSGA